MVRSHRSGRVCSWRFVIRLRIRSPAVVLRLLSMWAQWDSHDAWARPCAGLLCIGVHQGGCSVWHWGGTRRNGAPATRESTGQVRFARTGPSAAPTRIPKTNPKISLRLLSCVDRSVRLSVGCGSCGFPSGRTRSPTSTRCARRRSTARHEPQMKPSGTSSTSRPLPARTGSEQPSVSSSTSGSKSANGSTSPRPPFGTTGQRSSRPFGHGLARSS